MQIQDAFNIAVALSGVLGGWLLRIMWDAMRDLQAADKELSDKVSQIEIVVAGQYVRRDEFAELSRALFSKLDRIEDKLDGKVDK